MICTSLRLALSARLLSWSRRLYERDATLGLRRQEQRLLLFFHGYSLAHTIRPLVMGRALRQRGYRVEFAGMGPHRERIAAEGFPTHPVETLPQSRMDEYVARGEYAYYDRAWIERCVQAERDLIRRLRPALVLGDMRPTLRLSAALEGVDLALVEAAYTQPGYPFPLRVPFAVAAGPFEEYLHQQKALKPHARLHLLADVPEFHPPGSEGPPPSYYYVGPLIEQKPAPRTLPTLQDWDPRLPLICFNCGSTGAPPDFIETILRDFEQAPYRLLLLTAGRWSGDAPSPRIRWVDFLPLDWVLPHAALLVGIGGIGSIYHALRQGVPILGAPEHLDQEYHLNRVRDLGLGIKLDWEVFHRPGGLRQAVERLLTRYEEYRARCEAFSAHVRRWEGGVAMADIVDRHFAARSSPVVASALMLPETAFARQLELSTPPTLDARAIRRLLRENLARGLPHRRQGATLYFDPYASWNWLYDYEPRFFESDYRALEEKRVAFFLFRQEKLRARIQRQRYRLTYCFRVQTSTLPANRRAYLFLPYPIPGPHQEVIGLRACHPEALRAYLLPRVGFFYAYPLPMEARQEWWEFFYTCEVSVAARAPGEATPVALLSSAEQRRYTQVPETLQGLEGVARCRRALGLADLPTACEKARRIYDFLARTRRFKKTKDACQCLSCSAQRLLADEGGHCISLANTFIALCRLEGMPARDVTGALAGYPQGEGRYGMSAFNEPLFGHTWAEVYLPEGGWMPVEFHGIVIGPQALTEDNVHDEALRAHIEQGGEAYLDYYFGHLDCHRVVCSNAVKKIPPVLVEQPTPAGAPHLAPPVHLNWECELLFACL